MHCLVVFAHPDPDSYGAALLDSVRSGLLAGGHTVEVCDLYADGFQPAMDANSHQHYLEIGAAHPDPLVADYISKLKASDALVFVYPTWWSGLPAMLKGWLDRVLLPGVAFKLNKKNKVQPDLRRIKRLVVVTTTGSPWWYTLALGNAGRRTIMRTVRIICSRRCRTTYLALDRLDDRNQLDRQDFLFEVEKKLASL